MKPMILFGVACLILVFAGNVGADETTLNTELPEFYNACIDDLICRCETKMDYKDSKSQTIRKAAAIAVIKSAYLNEFRSDLVKEMQSNQVEPKVHKVEYFINSKFYAIMH